jgi:succinate dehydrogenase/fumarate reductase cytochrome b subunit
MKKISRLLFLLPILPYAASAQTLTAQSFIANFLTFTNTVLIPFLIAIAFLLFIINVIRFFVVQGGDEKSHENARSLATYGILAFVVLVVFWGVVNLLASSLGYAGKSAPVVDYVQKNSD